MPPSQQSPAQDLDRHLLHIIILPPGLGHVVIGKDLSACGSEKPSAKNIQVYFRTSPGEAQERVVVFVGRWLATACHSSVVQSQSSSVFAEGKHNMDEADARLIGLDNRLRNPALGVELLKGGLCRRLSSPMSRASAIIHVVRSEEHTSELQSPDHLV